MGWVMRIASKTAAGMVTKKVLRNHAADDRTGNAAEECAGQKASHPCTAARSAKDALHGAGLAHLRARRHTRQLRRIVAHARCNGTLRVRQLDPQLVQHLSPLVRRELRKSLRVGLLDGFRRRRLEHVAVARDRLFVLGQSRLLNRLACRWRLAAAEYPIEDAYDWSP